jgi:catechol 2,3-dioxygenase-like lactoylglutathione lyase family enzyme
MLRNLNHFLVLARDLEATRDFYVEVLGLRVGERPPFRFPGYWLYLGDQAVVHLAARDSYDNASHAEREDGGTGSLDHVAFEASGRAEMAARLEERGLPFRQREVPGFGLHQIFVKDPDGVTIELNFRASDPGSA